MTRSFLSVRDRSVPERFQKRKGMAPMTQFANYALCYVKCLTNRRRAKHIKHPVFFVTVNFVILAETLYRTGFEYYAKSCLVLKPRPQCFKSAHAELNFTLFIVARIFSLLVYKLNRSNK